jgi:hypothetical protein
MKESKKYTITMIMMFIISAIIITLPTAIAQLGTNWPSFPVLSLIPDHAGVGQEVLISYGITRQTAWPQSGWTGITISVTKPDGTSETLGPYNTDTTGLGGAVFIPTMVGTYSFVSNFPSQEVEVSVAGLEAGTMMEASQTPAVTLSVTEGAAVDIFPGTPLPDEYWVRPIDAQNREWWVVSGSWLDGSYKRSGFNRNAPYNDGPKTSHILWEMVQDMGGLAGGAMWWQSHEDGDAYEGKWSNPIIVSGILIGRRYVRGANKVYAVNVRTGEKMWEKTLGEELNLTLSPSFGQVFYWDTLNNHGCYSYLWATSRSTWYAFDPLTGRWEYTMTNVPGGRRVPGPKGEIMLYNINTRDGELSIWNSTAAYYDMRLVETGYDNPLQRYHSGRWRPIGMTFGAGNGTQVTTSCPSNLDGSVELVIPLDKAIGTNMNWAGGEAEQNPRIWAIDLRPGHEGELIFDRAWPIPQAGVHYDFAGSHPFSVEHDLFVITGKETRKHYGISMTTGQQLWATDAFEPYNNAYSNVYMDPWGQAVCYEDKLLTQGFGGVVTAYSLVDGSMLWQYEAGNEYGEFLFGNDWSLPCGFTTDGKIYLFHTEHSAIDPKPRGAPAVCLDIETGDVVWRIDGLRLGTRWGGQAIIGDSVICGFSTYDNTIVALGKGPSELTVSIDDDVITHGSNALVTGTLMDVSPGTKSSEQMLRFPHGVPAVADAGMSEWMLYVYKHRPMPDMVEGVTVRVEIVDPNGNYQNLGTTKSDLTGNFGFVFEPEVPGLYQILATFDGSGAFYGSYSMTYLQVDEAVAPSIPIEPEQPVTPLILTELLAIFSVVAIAIIAILAYFIYRRRK